MLRGIFIFLIISFLLNFYSCSRDNIAASDNVKSVKNISGNYNSKTKNDFLDTLLKTSKQIEDIKLKFISYEKLYDIKSKEDKASIISKLMNREAFYFLDYDKFDKSLSDLKFFTFEDFKKINLQAALKNSRKIYSWTEDFLLKNISVGSSIFKLNWEMEGKKFTTLSVFDDGRFIYGNILSNIITYEISTWGPTKNSKLKGISTWGPTKAKLKGIKTWGFTKTSKGNMTTNNTKSANYGASISAYFMGGVVSRGRAYVETTVKYTTHCMPGGTGSSYCYNSITSSNIQAYCDMTWGNCDAQYMKISESVGSSGHVTVAYAMYLATSAASASISWTGGSGFFIQMGGDLGSIEKGIGEYTVSASELPLN